MGSLSPLFTGASACLFDLDGTLTDSKTGIINALQYALGSFGIKTEPEALHKFIGPPLRESFAKHYSFNQEEVDQALRVYREYYGKQGIFENALYPGIDHLLHSLCQRDKILAVATSKPEFYARKILEHFKIDQYFTFVSGAELDERRGSKTQVIQYVFENIKIPSLNQAVMIGDKEHDVIGARAVGIESIGVLYGYGSREELVAAGASYIVQDIQELLALLQSG